MDCGQFDEIAFVVYNRSMDKKPSDIAVPEIFTHGAMIGGLILDTKLSKPAEPVEFINTKHDAKGRFATADEMAAHIEKVQAEGVTPEKAADVLEKLKGMKVAELAKLQQTMAVTSKSAKKDDRVDAIHGQVLGLPPASSPMQKKISSIKEAILQEAAKGSVANLENIVTKELLAKTGMSQRGLYQFIRLNEKELGGLYDGSKKVVGNPREFNYRLRETHYTATKFRILDREKGLLPKQEPSAAVSSMVSPTPSVAAPSKSDAIPEDFVKKFFNYQYATDLAGERFKALPQAEQDRLVSKAMEKSRTELETLAKRIADKDPTLAIQAMMHPSNRMYREVFTMLTGKALPKNATDTAAAMVAYVGKDKIDAIFEKKDADKAAKDKVVKDKEDSRVQGIKDKIEKGEPVNGHDLVDAAKSVGVEIHPRTVRMLRDRVNEISNEKGKIIGADVGNSPFDTYKVVRAKIQVTTANAEKVLGDSMAAIPMLPGKGVPEVSGSSVATASISLTKPKPLYEMTEQEYNALPEATRFGYPRYEGGAGPSNSNYYPYVLHDHVQKGGVLSDAVRQSLTQTMRDHLDHVAPASALSKQDGLWHGDSEHVFAAMRDLDKSVQHDWKRSRELQPPQGTVGVGSADFDHTLKAITGEAYLSALRKGKTPEEAHGEAKEAGNYAVKQWNEKSSKGRMSINNRAELQRWAGAGESEADTIHRRFTQAVGE